MRGGGGGKEERLARKGRLTRGPATQAIRLRYGARWRPRRLGLRLLALVVVVVAALALWKLPQWQLAAAREQLANVEQLSPADRLLVQQELLQAETAARATLVLILAGGGLLAGLGIMWWRFELNRELRNHERFATAVEQLASERSDGAPRTETRLGGIYALERLAAASDRDYWPVVDVLTAYVRENAAWKRSAAGSFGATSVPHGGTSPQPAADIQAVMAVLGRRRPYPAEGERWLLDLRETDLRGANLSGARLEGVTLHGAHLEQAEATGASLARSNLREADLTSATLSDANLEGASLSRATLAGARLNGARLKGADLSGANLQGADLWQADLHGCNLKDADLRGADLTQCDLGEAILWRANLADAVLSETNLRETHLERANLAGARGLAWAQGEDAYTDENTILPDYLLAGHAQAAAQPAPSAAELPPDAPSVLELNSGTRAGARSTSDAAPDAEAKRAALSKRRKAGLKPA